MTSWLDPVVSALDRRSSPLEIFVRDDDGGWEDGRLLALLDLFAEESFPIDVAAIPAATAGALAIELSRRAALLPLGIHQHGFAHVNHEPEGRACEFGAARPIESQRTDIRLGRQMLLDRFGPHLDPIFTPPWNRCTTDTGRALVASGIRAISCDITARRLDIAGLTECPVHADWFAKARGRRLDRHEWASMLARHVADAAGPVGIMLHHAEMDAAELDACEEVVRTVAAHPRVHVVPMRDVVMKS